MYIYKSMDNDKALCLNFNDSIVLTKDDCGIEISSTVLPEENMVTRIERLHTISCSQIGLIGKIYLIFSMWRWLNNKETP